MEFINFTLAFRGRRLRTMFVRYSARPLCAHFARSCITEVRGEIWTRRRSCLPLPVIFRHLLGSAPTAPTHTSRCKRLGQRQISQESDAMVSAAHGTRMLISL